MEAEEIATPGAFAQWVSRSLLIVLSLTGMVSCDSGPGASQGIQGTANRPAYILNYSQRALYALDLQGPSYLGHVKFSSPGVSGPIFSSTANTLYVFANKETRIHETGAAILGFDTTRNEIAEKILLPTGYLWHGSFGRSRSGSFYVLGSTHSTDSDAPPAQYVVEIDSATGAISSRIRLQSQHGRHRASSVQVSPGSQWAAVISSRVSQSGDTTSFHADETSLILVNLNTGKQMREMQLDRWLRLGTFIRDGKVLFVVSLSTGHIYRVNMSTLNAEIVYTLPKRSSSRGDEGRPFPIMRPMQRSQHMLLHFAMTKDSTHFVAFNADGAVVEKHALGVGGRSAFCHDAALCFARPARISETFPSREISSEMSRAIIQSIDMEKWQVTRTDSVKIPDHALQASEFLIP